MNNTSLDILFSCLKQILRPVAAFCLRRNLSFQTIIEALKLALVEEATQHLQKSNDKINSSRIAAATGLHRREVQRIFDGHKKTPNSGLIVRVLGQWQGNENFQTKAGKPRALKYTDEDNEFISLVKQTSSDLHPGTVLFELERIGAVERIGNKIYLKNEAYMPIGDPEAIFKLYAIDGDHLITAIEENALDNQANKNLHIRTEYDNIDVAALPAIKQWLYQQGNLLHHKARMFLAKHDLDLNPDPKKIGGAKIVLGSFSRTIKPQGKNEI